MYGAASASSLADVVHFMPLSACVKPATIHDIVASVALSCSLLTAVIAEINNWLELFYSP